MRVRNALIIGFLLTATATAAVADETETGLSAEEFSGVAVQSRHVFVTGQPTRKGLEEVADRGIATVVNLRTPEEMAALDFDERSHASDLGLRYVQIPSGGPEHPYSSSTLESFAEVMANTDGEVLLHCKSATRASHLWVAYLVRYEGVPLSEALEEGRSIRFGTSPIEGYLQGEIEYRYAPRPD